MINAIGIALTGLDSASMRLNASASNIANVSTAGSLSDESRAPYTPLDVVSEAVDVPGGVMSTTIPRTDPFVPAYDADSPFADANGFIGVPNVDLAEEAVNAKMAALSYEANLSTIKVAGELFDELLSVFDAQNK